MNLAAECDKGHIEFRVSLTEGQMKIYLDDFSMGLMR